MDMDVDRDGVGWRSYLRVKVWVDMTKPLVRGSLMNPLVTKPGLRSSMKDFQDFVFNVESFNIPNMGALMIIWVVKSMRVKRINIGFGSEHPTRSQVGNRNPKLWIREVILVLLALASKGMLTRMAKTPPLGSA